MFMRSATEQTIISVSAKMTAGGSVTAVGSGVAGKTIRTASENPEAISQVIQWTDVGVICGIVVGVLGLAAQIFFHWRRDVREREVHRIKLEGMRNQ